MTFLYRELPSSPAHLTRWLYKNAGYGFIALTTFAVVAFWPRYLSQPLGQDIRFHLHAAALGGWCALLITQALLIRREAIGRVEWKV